MSHRFATLKLSLAAAAVAAGTITTATDAHALDNVPTVTMTVTVDGVDYPVCAEEDCSDRPGQIGVWFDPDTGDAWLSLGETSIPIRR